MTYYLDTESNTVYHAVVLLTNAEHPSKPPLVVRVEELLADARFRVADTCLVSYRARPLSPE